MFNFILYIEQISKTKQNIHLLWRRLVCLKPQED